MTTRIVVVTQTGHVEWCDLEAAQPVIHSSTFRWKHVEEHERDPNAFQKWKAIVRANKDLCGGKIDMDYKESAWNQSMALMMLWYGKELRGMLLYSLHRHPKQQYYVARIRLVCAPHHGMLIMNALFSQLRYHGVSYVQLEATSDALSWYMNKLGFTHRPIANPHMESADIPQLIKQWANTMDDSDIRLQLRQRNVDPMVVTRQLL